MHICTAQQKRWGVSDQQHTPRSNLPHPAPTASSAILPGFEPGITGVLSEWTETNAFTIEPQDQPRKRKITALHANNHNVENGVLATCALVCKCLAVGTIRTPNRHHCPSAGGMQGGGSTSRGKSRDSCAFLDARLDPMRANCWGGWGTVVPLVRVGSSFPFS